MYRIARGLRARGGHGLCGILVLSLGPFLAGLELLHAQAQVIGEPDTKAGDSSLQLRGAEPPQLVTTAQRLMMEQIEDLIQAGESQEAIQILDKVFDHIVAKGSAHVKLPQFGQNGPVLGIELQVEVLVHSNVIDRRDDVLRGHGNVQDLQVGTGSLDGSEV